MSIVKLIFRNVIFYRWPYLAILAGVIVSTAVLTGALLVGDSVRGSLGRLAELRLGDTRWAMQPGDRYFRSALAADLSRELEQPVVPVLQLTGIGVNVMTGNRLQDIQVVGVDNSFSSLWKTSPVLPQANEVIISENVASRLALEPGDPLLIRLPQPGNMPQNAPFVADETPAASIRLTVIAIAGDDIMGRFSLKSNQRAPYNAFVSMDQLATRVGLPGSANLLLIPGEENDELTAEKLDQALESTWQMADAGIKINPLDESGLSRITTDRIFFDDLTAFAIRTALPDALPLFTYLANTLTSTGKETPYSFVAAVDEGILPMPLSPGEIVVTDWLATDLDVRPGDSLYMTYYVMESLRRLNEIEAGFIVSGIIPIRDIPDGQAMMPDFPGMSGAGNCRDWETGAPVELDRIRDKDEAYWNTFKGTPKAFITMADGKRLWENPFGTVTAFRFKSNPVSVDSLIMAAISPSWHRFIFQPVRDQGQQAAANSTDFGGLFLSLSFFLLASSLLLTALLFSLHARTRMSETGVLTGLGFRKWLIMRILFSEALLVAIPGVILGAIAGILYNKLILLGLNTLWQDAVRTSMLRMEVNFPSLATGAAAGFILAGCVLFLTLRRQLRRPVTGLVKETLRSPGRGLHWKIRVWMGTGIILVIISIVLLVVLLADSIVPDAGLYLTAGGLMMGGGIALVYVFLIWRSKRHVTGHTGLLSMIMRLGSMKRGRSMAAISLLALGTFTVIITGANRKTFFGAERDRQSGTGGFLLWAETTMPLLYDLNTTSGKAYFTLDDELLLQDLRYLQLHRLDGNDASCLNLNQVPQPMMLGIPGTTFDTLGAFNFVNLLPEVDPEHPWLTLRQELSPGVIPAFADQSVITWGLRKTVGDTLRYLDEAGRVLQVKLMGGLANSIFQGHILVSDSLLKNRFPSISGTRIMLVEGPFDYRRKITNQLEELFVDYGLVAVPASERLAEFNSVENTYLSVFMLLGALGVLIGTVGFGIILWRNNLERTSELALYMAIGFRKNYIRKMLMIEYLLILLAGMILGIIGAVAGILPSLISPAYQMPGGFLIVILGMIWISGAVWILIPVQLLFKRNLIQTLRKE
ncbi:MAG: ABC transporter permease [Bacteroidales bacterium]|nr:ABC transporter permease [Bacteroidota bacterium]MBL6949206.1 ABC transporter permease [Bacteroidales bacterium]